MLIASIFQQILFRFIKTQYKFAMGLAFLMLTFATVADGRQTNQQRSLTDAEMLEQLASADVEAADKAADMIVARGERLIGPLMKLRGDKRLFIC
jgi:hypothetical protein